MDKSTHVEGIVHLRPVRLGVLTDCGSIAALQDLLDELNERWGGCYCPVFSADLGLSQAEKAFRAYALDAMWDTTADKGGTEAFRARHLLWRGWADYGPLSSKRRYGHGMLPWRSLDGTSGLGVRDPLVDWFRSVTPQEPCPSLGWDGLASAFATRISNYGVPVIVIVNRGEPEHLRWSWNLRSLGVPNILVDQSMGPPTEEKWGEILTSIMPWTDAERDTTVVVFWDLATGRTEPDASLSRAIAAQRAGLQVTYFSARETPNLRQGTVSTTFEQPFQVSMPYGVMRTSLSLPGLPLAARPRGQVLETHTVAAEVRIEQVAGPDPRLVGRLPPDPAFSDLLEHVTDDVPRVLRATSIGYVAGVRASAWRMRLQLHRKTDVFSRALGDDVEVSQSDVGLFQTRAGELLDGSGSGTLTQPGMAAALQLLAAHPRGVPAQRIGNTIANNRGRWPGELWNTTAKQYADGVFDHLMRSGMISAVLRAKCSYCKAWMYLEPQQLAQEVHCDFCGQDVRLSPILGRRTHEWVFRLAGHLGQSQVQAMVPVLATVGQLAHLSSVEGGLDCHELGLLVMQGGRTVETDIAAILEDSIPTLILGEVKSRNRIDADDVANLEWVRSLMSLNDMRSQLLFATSKDDFGDEERAVLREHCERQILRADELGRLTLPFPLLLTGQDLFLPWSDDDNIWRAGTPGYGLNGIAEESCRRRLGLSSWHVADLASGKAELNWVDE